MTRAFTVYGPPVPKERPRKGHSGRFYTPRRTAEYERTVALAARAAGVQPIADDVYLSIAVVNHRRGDLDNIGKSIADALNGIAYPDDSHITRFEVLRRYDTVRPEPRVYVVIDIDDEERPA